jgi:hypothetical protein
MNHDTGLNAPFDEALLQGERSSRYVASSCVKLPSPQKYRKGQFLKLKNRLQIILEMDPGNEAAIRKVFDTGTLCDQTLDTLAYMFALKIIKQLQSIQREVNIALAIIGTLVRCRPSITRKPDLEGMLLMHHFACHVDADADIAENLAFLALAETHIESLLVLDNKNLTPLDHYLLENNTLREHFVKEVLRLEPRCAQLYRESTNEYAIHFAAKLIGSVICMDSRRQIVLDLIDAYPLALYQSVELEVVDLFIDGLPSNSRISKWSPMDRIRNKARLHTVSCPQSYPIPTPIPSRTKYATPR